MLQGGGPFVDNDDLDRRILDGVGRVVVLPTADAYEQPADLVEVAAAWGERIGVEVEPVMVLTRRDITDETVAAVAGAPAVFLAGDSGIHLRSVLKDTPLFDAIRDVLERDGIVIASAQAAAALCDPLTDGRGGAFALGLGLVDGVALVTRAGSWPADQLERTRSMATTPLVELPVGSALIRSGDEWTTFGDVVVRGELP